MRTALALRSLAFVLLVPGVVAGYVPFLILRGTAPTTPPPTIVLAAASALILIGAAVLLRCVWDFFAGGGTLAPVDPPKVLVVRGLYRYTRNPMYNGVLAVLLGEAWLFRSAALLLYAAIFVLTVHLFVVLYEEPALRSQFGEQYLAYRRSVPRWGVTTRPYVAERRRRRKEE
jgi:protein-S-isoprenylcysteine O-methyltransferase Ste14